MDSIRQTALTFLILAAAVAPSLAQDASRGIAMPVTLTGGLLASERPRAADDDAARAFPGFQAVFYPGLKINSKWFVQSTVDVRSEPFYEYEDFYTAKNVVGQVRQLFLGYRRTGDGNSISMKVGKLNSVFGSFPLRYSTSVNPLLDSPFAYAYVVKLRPDQMPCGSMDLAHQKTYPIYVEHYCGGSTAVRNGMVPVTLSGLPGAEFDVAWRRMDARFQLTNSSPSNPQDLNSNSQHVQWTAGAGYTLRQGFRIGVSGFQGPFLDEDVRSLLPSGTGVRDFPAAAIGTDLQWGHGRWSANAEWQRIEFRYPRFVVPPAMSSGYVELKATLNPRFYAAIRAGFENHSSVQDAAGIRVARFLPNRQAYEIGLGYRLNRLQTLKASYEWLKTDGVSGTRDNIIGLQFVTSIHALSKSF